MSQCFHRVPACSAVLFQLCTSVLSPGFLSAQADTTHPLTKHRKIASSFRDSSLFDIFTLSCNLLKQVRKLSLSPLVGAAWWGGRLWVEVTHNKTLGMSLGMSTLVLKANVLKLLFRKTLRIILKKKKQHTNMEIS